MNGFSGCQPQRQKRRWRRVRGSRLATFVHVSTGSTSRRKPRPSPRDPGRAPHDRGAAGGDARQRKEDASQESPEVEPPTLKIVPPRGARDPYTTRVHGPPSVRGHRPPPSASPRTSPANATSVPPRAPVALLAPERLSRPLGPGGSGPTRRATDGPRHASLASACAPAAARPGSSVCGPGPTVIYSRGAGYPRPPPPLNVPRDRSLHPSLIYVTRARRLAPPPLLPPPRFVLPPPSSGPSPTVGVAKDSRARAAAAAAAWGSSGRSGEGRARKAY